MLNMHVIIYILFKSDSYYCIINFTVNILFLLFLNNGYFDERKTNNHFDFTLDIKTFKVKY